MRALVFASVFAAVLLACGASLAAAHTAAEWRSRTIYQLLTDRFSTGTKSAQPCSNLGAYCGGTFAGVVEKLDYIQGMGFDAIWISPVVDNTDGGYHGYWAQNLFAINSHFGTASDLNTLVEECHKRDMWVMLDVVGNHMGYGAPSGSFAPLDQPEMYHDCDSCPQYCNIDDWQDQDQVQLCRLVGLPDLNQSNPYVANVLNTWIKQIVANYSFDGIRIDTVPEVNKPFWGEFKASSGVFAIGEIENGDIGYVSSYQSRTPGTNAPGVDGTLSYPLYFTLRNVFQNGQSMSQLHDTLQTYKSAFADTSILGTFADNHDNPRFLSGQQDRKMYEALITFVLMAEGIPIVYYGTEQWLSGTNDPNNREALWNTGYSTDTDMYTLIKLVNTHRSKVGAWKETQVQRYVDDEFYAFTRGNSLVCLTNQGSNKNTLKTISYHPYAPGTKICNIMYPDNTDCVTVNGSFQVYLKGGESKIYYPVQGALRGTAPQEEE